MCGSKKYPSPKRLSIGFTNSTGKEGLKSHFKKKGSKPKMEFPGVSGKGEEGGEEVKPKHPPWEGYEYFLKQPI